ncbi:universal stress protein, partial [Frankia sp. EI5c]|uniref:universal stress protein n=1 Tax=Frankia sp. EI5c TaxID=683316 RepID=UPI001F5BB6C9
RGRGLLHRLRIGSVSASVAVHSPVPVVVARTPRKGDADGEPSAQPAADDGSVRETPGASTRRPVVVGVDGSPNSLAALRWAADEAALRGAPLHVVHAWLAAVPLPFAETSSDILQTLEEQARVVLDDSIEEVLGTASGSTVPDERGGQPAEGGDPTGRARSAPPGASTIEIHRLLVAATATRALLEESREAELLVVGARGKGGFAELLLGSVSHQTMLHSAAPVAIVRDV